MSEEAIKSLEQDLERLKSSDPKSILIKKITDKWPSYGLMGTKWFKAFGKIGRLCGGRGEDWSWDIDAVEKLTINELKLLDFLMNIKW